MNDPVDLPNLMLQIADLVCDCLESTEQEGVTATGRPSFCGTYWNTPPDDLDCGDCGTNGALFVWLERMGASVTNWPAPWAGPVSAAPSAFTIPVALVVRLIRPCWPVVGQTGIATPFPTRETTETASINLNIDAATVFCCLLTAMKDPSSVFGLCSRVTAPVLTPDRNRASCAGFDVRFIVDLAQCCT